MAKRPAEPVVSVPFFVPGCSRRLGPAAHLLVVSLLLLMLNVDARAAVEGKMCVENATISDLQQALAAGRTTAAALVSAYLARIRRMTVPARASTRCAR